MNNLTEKTVELLNYRIQQEELSSRLYLQMANELEYKGYFGAAKLWRKYSEEENLHAKKVYEFLLDCDYQPEVPKLESPKKFNNNFIEIIKASYIHEQEVTRQCSELYKEALKEGDILTLQLAQWFVTEQVEELNKTKYWLDRIEAFGTSPESLRLLDSEMADV